MCLCVMYKYAYMYMWTRLARACYEMKEQTELSFRLLTEAYGGFLKLVQLQNLRIQVSKYKCIFQTALAIPSQTIIDTPYLGTLGQ